MFSVFLSIVRRDLLLAARSPGERLAPSLFFVAATAVFPLGASPNPEVLRQSAPAVIWVAALLAALLSQDSLFRDDRDDGALEQALLAPQPLALFVLAKSAAHFIAVGAPLLALSPVLGVMLGLSLPAAAVLAFTMIPGAAVFSLFGAFSAALTLGIRAGGCCRRCWFCLRRWRNSARGDAAGAAGFVLRAGADFRRRGCFRRRKRRPLWRASFAFVRLARAGAGVAARGRRRRPADCRLLRLTFRRG